MSVRNTQEHGPDPLYSNDAELEYVEGELARVMYCAGLDWADINTTTIDDIIHKIDETYEAGAQVHATTEWTAWDAWNHKQATLLYDITRRAWRSRTIALALV